jgi:hypothetical protein
VWVYFNGNNTSSSTTVSFSAMNGTYYYSVSQLPGYIISNETGEVHVMGGNVTVQVHFTMILYTVEFTEEGLPPGTYWQVTVGNHTYGTYGTHINFTLPYGTYSYRVSTDALYYPGSSLGYISAGFQAVSSVNVVFHRTIAENFISHYLMILFTAFMAVTGTETVMILLKFEKYGILPISSDRKHK